jgi:hypothetical protein
MVIRHSTTLAWILLATSPVVAQAPLSQPRFTFAKEQRVYIVAVDSSSRNASVTKAALELERYAKDQFRKHHVFQIANTLREADFVFFVMLDSDSSKIDEIAIVISPPDYHNANGDIDGLRDAALWQSDNHFKNAGAEAALAGATLGWSAIFHHVNVVAGLVKQFHKDTIGR